MLIKDVPLKHGVVAVLFCTQKQEADKIESTNLRLEWPLRRGFQPDQ